VKQQNNTSTLAWLGMAAALALAGLASCGGVGSGGSGMTTDGVTEGTANGFGSVIVDGVRYDDRSASVVTEVAPGSDAISEIRLGHRVTVQFETAGVAHTMRADAALAGPVASIDSASQFTLLGQAVRVNTNGTAGPITQFAGGYTQLSDMRARDAVSVHGFLVKQATSYVIQATRIDKLSTLPAYLRATGMVSNLAGTFTLGTLTVDMGGATLLPAGSTLANGQTVTLLALPASLQTTGPGAPRLTAAQVRVQGLRDTSQDRQLSGSVSQLNLQAKTFALGGVTVNYAAATLSPTTTVLSEGLYVVVRGMPAANGTLVANSVTIRDAGADSESELRGTITAYDAVARRLTVREVLVDVTPSTEVEACPAGGLAVGLYVEVEGRLTSTGVVAKSVHCEDEPSGAVVEREGVAGSVDPVGKTFTLIRPLGGNVSVRWSDTTYFGSVTVPTLPGSRVEVEGVFVNGVLVARKVALEN